jgi:hypothetical protein
VFAFDYLSDLLTGCFTCAVIGGVANGWGSGGTWNDSGNRLPDNWTPFPLGQCAATTSTPALVQAVGYSPSGTTCSFQNFPSNLMPAVFQQQDLLAMSTDVYVMRKCKENDLRLH